MGEKKEVKYLKLRYRLSFWDKPYYGNPPAFVFRSVLGLNLRKLTCVLRQEESCSNCMVKTSCVYSTFFETNVDKNLNSLSGRDKATHPFVLDIIEAFDDHAIIEITFIGRARNYIPYVNLALENAGKKGIGKNRARFSIVDIMVGDEKFYSSLEQIEEHSLIWPLSDCLIPKQLLLETPCRIKEGGRYISDLNLWILLKNMQRRMQVLEELFGEGEAIPVVDSISEITENITLKWVEKRYYSSRQKTVMRLGGVIGSMDIKGDFDSSIISYIDAMALFHVGKNISFGFGKIKVVY